MSIIISSLIVSYFYLEHSSCVIEIFAIQCLHTGMNLVFKFFI